VSVPLLFSRSYIKRILRTRPIALWPLSEPSGTVAIERVHGWHGTHVGVTLGQPGIGDGNTCPLYDGVNDYTNVYSAELAGAFNGSEGSLMAWAKVANAGVWTDGTTKYAATVYRDSNNRVFIAKSSSANNCLVVAYYAGAGTANIARYVYGVTSTDWLHLCLTWSAGANEAIAYVDAQPKVPVTDFGAWVGAPTAVLIGAASITPTSPWSGTLGPVALWDRALTPGEVAALARVR